jgi:hypothetical protein
MKRKLLILFCLIFVVDFGYSQVTAGQVDNFEDGTTQGWIHGGASSNPPTNQSVGGTDGNFLRNPSSGGSGAGSRHALLNRTQWIGDFVSAGIPSITMDVRNNGATTLNLRLAFASQSAFSSIVPHWVSTNSIDIAVGSGWTTITFPIDVASMSQSPFAQPDTYANVMGACVQMRIISSAALNHKGDLIVGELDIDNITADFPLSNDKFAEKPDFKISPNPSSRKLNLNLSRINNNTSVEVFDVLGKKIYADRIEKLNKSVDVSQWNNGVYLVRLTSDNGTQTKRFVKQ